ncbi:MAG: hypothetical protein AAF939_06310 [Planctomycetota bacterium]
MVDNADDLVDPLEEPAGKDKDDGLVADDGALAPPSDNLDLEFVDEFDAEDFDEDFDDDFEEEVEGEYELEDDQYGEDFDKEFGHLTDPNRKSPSKNPDPKRKPT